MKHPYAFALLLGLVSSSASASFFEEYMTDPEDGKLDASRYLSEVPLGFLPVPSIITEPAVGYGLAVAGIFFHESEEQRKQRTSGKALLPNNITIIGGGGTENGTWGSGLGHIGFWRDDTIRYKGFLMYGSINLDFYSLDSVELPRAVELEMDGPFVFQKLTFRIPDSHFFVGGLQLYRKVELGLGESYEFPSRLDPVKDFLQDNIQNDVTTSGLGFTVEYDTLNNPLNPEKGFSYSANYIRFDEAIGSDVEYDNYRFVGLNYWQLNDKFNLGIRMQLDVVDADDGERLPPYVPPFVDLRGVPKSRYQAEAAGEAEIQLDYKLDTRWKLSTFTGMGRAADKVSDFSDAENVYSYGVGFRYLIARRYGFSMGVDIARGPEETAFYIQAGSTW
ncbi:BamA/TamA family outer membrane protein [Pseudomaricurvus sp.]|uniref:BamA/TamA family outer membrane protein n=1 Tax=Pseudomaricurvus sp. TaxID=2004510 RepID=UPI003F6D032E